MEKALKTAEVVMQNEVLKAGLYPPIAFRERSKWGLPENLDDSDDHYRYNDGDIDWLIKDYNILGEDTYLLVFEYKQKVIGRCWIYSTKGAIFATNFYYRDIELNNETIVSLLKQLFNMNERVEFETRRSSPLPIRQDGDGIVIYDPTVFKSAEHFLDEINEYYSRCLLCNEEVKIKDLYKLDNEIFYNNRRVHGLIVCKDCKRKFKDNVICEDCNQNVDRDDAVFIKDHGYVCADCFRANWFECESCYKIYRSELAVFASENEKWLCPNCANELGTICEVCEEFYYLIVEDEEDEVKIKQYEITNQEGVHKKYICNWCAEKIKSYKCEQCGKEVQYLEWDMENEVLKDMVRLRLCLNCYQRCNENESRH